MCNTVVLEIKMYLYAIVLCVVFCYVDAASTGVLSGDKYTTRYDNIDIESILKSERLLRSYFRCIIDGVGCTPEGRILKDAIPDALQNNCAKCSEVQRTQAGRVMSYILQYRRDYWDKLLEKFDPDGKFRKQYGYGDDEDEEYDEDDAVEETSSKKEE